MQTMKADFPLTWLKSKYSKTCVKWPLSKRPKIGFQDQLSLNAGRKYFRMFILQYFRPSLSYHWSLRSLFCLFLSGCFTQVLLYRITATYLNKNLQNSKAVLLHPLCPTELMCLNKAKNKDLEKKRTNEP